MCAKFLWKGSIDEKASAKVAWNTVCLPKSEGRLGLRKFIVWNKVLCLRFVWLIFADSNSLWVKWHKHHHLRNISFWAVESKTADSASWKSILSLRPLAEQFLKCKVNNGANAYFWYDNWTLLGSLINFLGPTGPRDLRLPISASVRQASNPTGWRLPHPRSDNALALHAHLTTVIAPHQQTQFDSFHWIVDNKDCKGFSSSKTWEAIRPRLAKELGNVSLV